MFKGPVEPQTVEHLKLDLKSAVVPSVETKNSVS